MASLKKTTTIEPFSQKCVAKLRLEKLEGGCRAKQKVLEFEDAVQVHPGFAERADADEVPAAVGEEAHRPDQGELPRLQEGRLAHGLGHRHQPILEEYSRVEAILIYEDLLYCFVFTGKGGYGL